MREQNNNYFAEVIRYLVGTVIKINIFKRGLRTTVGAKLGTLLVGLILSHFYFVFFCFAEEVFFRTVVRKWREVRVWRIFGFQRLIWVCLKKKYDFITQTKIKLVYMQTLVCLLFIQLQGPKNVRFRFPLVFCYFQ